MKFPDNPLIDVGSEQSNGLSRCRERPSVFSVYQAAVRTGSPQVRILAAYCSFFQPVTSSNTGHDIAA